MIRVLTVFVLLTTGLFPQWIPLNPAPEGEFLYTMYFTDDNHGWIAGSEGIIMKFNSQRFFWERQPKFTENDLYSIGFFDNLNGLVCGSNGTLLRSTDGGTTWLAPLTGLNSDLYKLQIFNESIAYIAGYSGVLLKTTDQGITWAQITPVTADNFTSVYFINEQFGFTGDANAKIHRTTDGGATWSDTVIPSPMPYYIHRVNDIQFIDNNLGFAGGGQGSNSGARFYWKTTDGGLSWNQETIYTHTILDLHFTADGWGLIAGGENTWNQFLILRSPNGSYSTLISGIEAYDIFCSWITPSGQAWAAGAAGTIYYSADFRSGWEQVYSGTMYKILSMDCSENYFFLTSEKYIWNSPESRVLRGTFDSLSTKELVSTPTLIWSLTMKKNILYIADWAVYISRSSDYGNSWESSFTTPARGGNIFFVNDSIGWRFGDYEGGVYKTTDGGVSWITQLQTFKAVSVSFVDNNTGFACSKTDLLHTTDGGLSWESIPLPDTGELGVVSFINSTTGVIAGKGILSITHDGGTSWENINPGSSTVRYTDVEFINNLMLVSTDDGFLLKSTDMGNNWTEIYFGQPVLQLASDGKQRIMASVIDNVYLYGLDTFIPVELINFTVSNEADHVRLEWYTSSETNNRGFEIERRSEYWETIGFIQGKGSSTDLNKYVFKDNIRTGGVETTYRLKQLDYSGAFSYSGEVKILSGLLSYRLFQNYPNPFNPHTRISFNLPLESHVKINVYDALGREVLLLINEKKTAGSHFVDLDGSNLTSGIYFYKMTAGKYSNVKKMIILR